MQRMGSSGTSMFSSLAVPHLKKKALNSWSAVQDTYFSTKDIFERHRVVFTVSTSLASVGTAWIGYSVRHLHDAKVEQRLDSIEKAVKNNYLIEHAEIKKMVDPGSSSTASCIATAGATLVLGYCLGWRGGKWYANRKFRREQMKQLGQTNPKSWQFQFLRRRLIRPKVPESAVKTPEVLQKDAQNTKSSKEAHLSSC